MIDPNIHNTILNPAGSWPQIISLLDYLKLETEPGEWLFEGVDNMGGCALTWIMMACTVHL